jgi:hypothetical protein
MIHANIPYPPKYDDGYSNNYDNNGGEGYENSKEQQYQSYDYNRERTNIDH